MIRGLSGTDLGRLHGGGVAFVGRIGPEVAGYTDHPDRVLKNLRLDDEALDVRIENVTVRDAYFRLTGESVDEPTRALHSQPA